MQKIFTFSFIIALAFCVILPNSAPAGGNELIISFWCAPPTTENVDQRYAEVAEANFTVVMNTCTSPTVESNLQMLDACQKYGMKAIVVDFRIMSKEPNDPEFEKNLDSVVADYSKHPAFFAYYLKDEPTVRLFPKLAAINQYLLKKDPAHICYANLLPIGVPVNWYGPKYKSYTDYVEDYITTVKPKLLSFDHYVLTNTGEIPNYFENMEIIREAALKHNMPWVYIFQLTRHGSYRETSESDLRWQIYTTLAYGGTGILYFTYWTPTDPNCHFYDSVITRDGKRTYHYEQVKRLNREVKALGPILLTLDSTGVYHTGTLPKGTKPLPEGTEVKSVEGTELVVGFFNGPDKSRWMMLTNRDINKVKDAYVTLDPDVAGVQEVDKVTGKLRDTDITKKSLPIMLDLRFKPGEGRLFKLTPAKQPK